MSNGDSLFGYLRPATQGILLATTSKTSLFINNGDGPFTEQAEPLALADQGFSTMPVFFDYDKDGDLDVSCSTLAKSGHRTVPIRMQMERPKARMLWAVISFLE